MAAKKKDKRLAQTRLPDGTHLDRPWTPAEMYIIYVRGFQDGAGVRPIRPDHEGLISYDQGYQDGQKARRKAMTAYAKKIGYVPSILRTV